MMSRKRLLAGLACVSITLPWSARAQEAAPVPAAPATTEAAPAVDPNAPPAPAAQTPPGPDDSTPNTPTDPTPAPEEPVELSAAELASLGLSTEGGEPPLDTSIKFFGFADFEVNTMIGAKDSAWRGLLYRYPTFMVGNFNLYLSKNITSRIRTMAEVRFTYQPNGSPDPTTGIRTSTSVTDYATSAADSRWGGVIPQRIYVEVDAHRLLTVRVGQFLTPYGIWNRDHGSPTIVSVQRPYVLNQQLFPERQTGFELYGAGRVGANHVLGYHVTLSNGFGPVSEYLDLDRNKAVGWRAFWQCDRFGQLQVGTSGFYGKDTSSYEVPGVMVKNGQPEFTYTNKITSQSNVLALAADLRWSWGNLLVQSELIVQQRKYTDKGRIGASNPFVGSWLSPQDGVAWGTYGLVGYRFEWMGIMPYVLGQKMQVRDPRTLTQTVPVGVAGGLNIRPVDAFVVKLEYDAVGWAKKNFISNQKIQTFNFQVAWAF